MAAEMTDLFLFADRLFPSELSSQFLRSELRLSYNGWQQSKHSHSISRTMKPSKSVTPHTNIFRTALLLDILGEVINSGEPSDAIVVVPSNGHTHHFA